MTDTPLSDQALTALAKQLCAQLRTATTEIARRLDDEPHSSLTTRAELLTYLTEAVVVPAVDFQHTLAQDVCAELNVRARVAAVANRR